MTVRAILFDLDGTLLDSIDGILTSFRHVLDRYVPEKSFTREHLVSVIGEPVPKQMLDFNGGDAELARTMVDEYRRHNATILPTLSLYPDTISSLRTIRARGQKIGVVTSKSRGSAMISLDGHGLTRELDLILTSDDTVKHKPDPLPLLTACQRLDLAPDEVAYVGDSVHDIRCALGAGCLAVAALWGPFPRQSLLDLSPHFTAESMPGVVALAALKR